MGKCARRTKKVIRVVARALSPIGIALVRDIVGIVDTTDWTNEAKRERAVELARGAIKARGIDARESAIRLTVEAAVTALKDGEAALLELGNIEPDDQAIIDADDDFA